MRRFTSCLIASVAADAADSDMLHIREHRERFDQFAEGAI
jgi:hypothetical protein